MELNRKEVPLYGQVEVCIVLQDLQSPQDKAEYYVVLEGSCIHHVTTAQRKGGSNLLSFTVPGHDVPEKVSVRLYCRGESSIYDQLTLLYSSEDLSLEYVQDSIQEVTNLLVSAPHTLTSSTYQDIQQKFCKEEHLHLGQTSSDITEQPGTSELKEGSLGFGQRKDEDISAWTKTDPDHTSTVSSSDLDMKVTQSLANMSSHLKWNNQQPQKSQDLHGMETPLHIAGRLGLYHLTLFCLQQSEGQNMATLRNEEGQTPVELALSRGHAATISALTHPSACKERRAVWMSDVWADESHLLRFCPLSSSFILTVKHRIQIDAERSIQFYRSKNGCSETGSQLTELTEAEEERRPSQTDGMSDGELTSQTSVEDCAVVDNVFEEPLSLSLDEDEASLFTCNTEKSSSPPGSCSSFQLHSTHSAADRLTAMLSRTGKNDDLHRKYNIDAVTCDSSGTGTPLTVKEEEGPKEHTPVSCALSSSLSHRSSTSPVGLVLDRFLRSTYNSLNDNSSTGSPPEAYELSPSLVALEMDSEEEDENFLIKTLLPQISSETNSTGDKPESTADLLCTYLNSASSDNNHAFKKEAADQGVRHRSYSYSSPKISLLPNRFSRDAQRPHADLNNDGVLSSSSSASRSLLQALSLSKSLSLLNPVKQHAQSLTEQPQEKRLEEEEWDKYVVPSKTEPEKYKVSRTFSFIKSRMYSTRSKNKGKTKGKEVKEKQANGHQFVAGPVLVTSFCDVCDKHLTGKDILHCNNCTISIHKVCKDSASPCHKKLQDKGSVSMMKARAATLPQNFIVRESSSSSQIPTSASLSVTTPQDRKESNPLPCPPSRSASLVPDWLAESPNGDSEPWSTHGQSDEPIQTMGSLTSNDSSFMEDTVDATLRNGLGIDTQDFDAESWSLIVEPQFCQKQGKRTVKRQDVIYELMLTELHHLQTLTIMAEVFRRGIREEVGLDADAVGRIFPCLDELLLLHRDFLSALKERRQSSVQPDSDKNYLIDRVGDILLEQFSQENAENMKHVYGEFCSRHTEAVNFFKELQQQNKRFQLFIKQQSSNSLVKRREIPECILLVTQRITKYPVLLERILQYTEEGTQEHADLSTALALVRELISAVDMRVSEREQSQWLNEVLGRMESRSSTRLKNGFIFRKQDITNGRALLHHGTLLWKTATGRLKDVLVLLLTDLLVFIQEKDQKYVFAAVDQKCPVVSLQKLIVREVANEERGMFLISASSSGPEMYEVHVTSKDERNTWMRIIREAVVICHEKENNTVSESEEERRVAESKSRKIHKLQESLCGHDQLICSSLEEKLQIYAELSALAGHGEFCPGPKLLVRPDTEELPNASILLSAALREAESLKAALSCDGTSPSSPLPAFVEQNVPDTSTKAEAFPSASSPSSLLQTEGETQPVITEKSEDEVEFTEDETLVPQPQNQSSATDNHNIHLKVCQSVQSLTQLLYSLQALITIQDSQYEVRRLLLLMLSNSTHPRLTQGSLQEQERQREAEHRRQELAQAAREQQQWAHECQVRQQCYEKRESELAQREQQCSEQAQQLQRQREELEEQLQEYQQCLERLREGQKNVEKEREKLEMQQTVMERWRHGHQHSFPSKGLKLEGHQGLECETKNFHPCVIGGLDEDRSIFVNEAVFLAQSTNNQHLHNHQDQYHRNTQLLPGHADSPSAQNSLNSLLALTNHAHPTIGKQDEQWTRDRDVDPPIHTQDVWETVGASLFPGDIPLVPQAFVSMETENQDAEREENIVYL